MSRWPLPYESIMVSTRFGQTHVVACGSSDGEPLLLLHGKYSSSTEWAPNIEPLGRRLHVFAVDIIGDAGKSRVTSRPRGRRAYAEWLREVMQGLGIAHAHLAGISYGGFLALNFALSYPSYVGRLVLMSPGFAIAPFSPRWVLSVALVTLFPTDRNIHRLVRLISLRGYKTSDPQLRQRLIAMLYSRGRSIPLPLFRARRLHALDTPTMVIFGEAEVMYDPKRAIAEAERLLPNARVEMVAGSGHSVNRDQPEVVNALLLEHLTQGTLETPLSQPPALRL